MKPHRREMVLFSLVESRNRKVYFLAFDFVLEPCDLLLIGLLETPDFASYAYLFSPLDTTQHSTPGVDQKTNNVAAVTLLCVETPVRSANGVFMTP